MAHMWKSFCDAFWSSKAWLPEGIAWEDLKSNSTDVYYPQVQDINWSPAVGVVLLLVRYMYERIVILPLAKALGVKDRRRVNLKPSPVLETAYSRKRGKNSRAELQLLAKKTELSVREIEKWFLRRRQKDSPSTMIKFREVSWHFLFYIVAFVYGMYILWQRPWFWDIKHCVIGWPRQHVDQAVYIFYLVELGFYWSLMISSAMDVKRSDFGATITHHLLTIALIYLSWSLNYVRYGAIILVLHDASDYWMAAAKMARYSKRALLCEVLFACFVVAWVVTRIGLYPLWVIRFIMFETHKYSPAKGFPHKVFLGLLCGLQVLHVIWTYLILKIVLQKFTHGELVDIRSDNESDDGIDVVEKEDSVKRRNYREMKTPEWRYFSL